MARAVEGDNVIALPGTYETDKVVPTLAEAGSEIAPTIPSRVVVKKGVTLESRDGAATTIIKGAPARGRESRCGWSGGLEEPGILPLSLIRSLPEYLQGLLGALVHPSLISGP